MDYKDELRKLIEEGEDAEIGGFVEGMERLLAHEAAYRLRVIGDLKTHLSRSRIQREMYLTLRWDEPSDAEREVVSLCEEWLEENGYEFSTRTEFDDSAEALVVVILLV